MEKKGFAVASLQRLRVHRSGWGGTSANLRVPYTERADPAALRSIDRRVQGKIGPREKSGEISQS